MIMRVLSIGKKGKIAAAVVLMTMACSTMAMNKPAECSGSTYPNDWQDVLHSVPYSANPGIFSPTARPKKGFLGTTPAEIDSKFATVLESNFSNGQAKKILTRLTNRELHDIADRYYATNVGRPSELLNIMARQLDGKSLTRVAAAFGYENVQRAVTAYSPGNVQIEFTRNASSIALGVPTPMAGPAPNINMTLQEIYLEFRTAPVGSLSPSAALTETSIYAGAYLYGAWKVGTAIGTQIYGLIQTYDPALDDAIGGTESVIVDELNARVSGIFNSNTQENQGYQEHITDGMYGYPVTDSHYNFGDWSDTWEMGEGEDLGCF
jgi:hypothetical protein